MAESKREITIRVYGRVQGVWFRKTTKDMADELGIYGTVQNEPDGSVYITAYGSDGQLDKFVTYCRRGPENANVENVIVNEEPVGEFRDFRII